VVGMWATDCKKETPSIRFHGNPCNDCGVVTCVDRHFRFSLLILTVMIVCNLGWTVESKHKVSCSIFVPFSFHELPGL
jgi:hypothetical protein